ncbi:UDP-glucose/GDP-mannose dehydrogenase family protein [Nitratireductor aquimarinus]|uniref:UDP-glucose 6-dehydrogenase n=1 Tax=Nitratireductor aquimarinus TaxID=889300 RepID=A0ABU4ANI5_9HYPH|nr:UDP-glucose/GDP-mannose dehydrogenase family protein [Nitratireductor aquimarinus]MDV6227807.1 UDP-glucose/GDP-mannose dehydrogenase family protein [Nitratireductor aquimarinus]
MNITIFGTGYVGLVQAAVFAEAGYNVTCVDIDAEKVSRLKKGEIPIYEPGLEHLVKENGTTERLHFTTDASVGIARSSIQFIAVGTPPDEDGSADLKHVLAVAKEIASHMEEHRIVVVKSTVPVGTSDQVRAMMLRTLKERGRDDLTFDVSSNPEFLKEGSAVADCTKPDRIIIGTECAETERALRELYAPFNRNHDKIISMDVRSAELTKYAANCMLATKISFMNEMANLAEKLDADIEKVRLGIGADPRIGYHFIYPGVGYGGSCFPKDVRAMIRLAQTSGYDPMVLNAVEQRNEQQKHVLFAKISGHFEGDIEGKTFALWGLSFKPNTNDMREAPSRVLMAALWQAGAKVRAYDPEAMDECRRIYGDREDLLLCASKEEALEEADALVVVTEWKSFRAPDFEAMKRVLRNPIIFDGRNIYDPVVASRKGLLVFSIGRTGQLLPSLE